MANGLLTTRRFAPLFWCQFFSAFNDNFLKNALVFLILFAPGVDNREALITLTGAIFIGPFFFLSGLGGQMADRFDKADDGALGQARRDRGRRRSASPASGYTRSRSCS